MTEKSGLRFFFGFTSEELTTNLKRLRVVSAPSFVYIHLYIYIYIHIYIVFYEYSLQIQVHQINILASLAWTTLVDSKVYN